MTERVCCFFAQGSWCGFFSPLSAQGALRCALGVGLGPAGEARTDQLPRVSLPLTLPSKPGGLELWEKTKKGWLVESSSLVQQLLWGTTEKVSPKHQLGSQTNALLFVTKGGRRKEGRKGGSLSFSCTYAVPGTEVGHFHIQPDSQRPRELLSHSVFRRRSRANQGHSHSAQFTLDLALGFSSDCQAHAFLLLLCPIPGKVLRTA